MARKLMARLPWLIRTRFWVTTKIFRWLKKQIFRDVLLFYYQTVRYVYSLESPHRGNTNEYTQHTILCRKIENKPLNHLFSLSDLAAWLTFLGTNYPCLEDVSMVPKMFEPLKLDCSWRNFNDTHARSPSMHVQLCNIIPFFPKLSEIRIIYH